MTNEELIAEYNKRMTNDHDFRVMVWANDVGYIIKDYLEDWVNDFPDGSIDDFIYYSWECLLDIDFTYDREQVAQVVKYLGIDKLAPFNID